MSEKRASSDSQPEEEPPAKMSRQEAPTTNGTSGDDDDRVRATPLPISNPFQERFRAPELSSGEFHVLDEARSDDEAEDSGEEDSDMDEDELMEMLDADLPDKFKGTRRVKGRAEEDDDGNYEERDKVVLIERGRNPVEPMPEGWVQVTHMSGMPVYLHRQSRVVSLTRPYFLGPGSLRKHDIPLYSIPCLQYLRELQKEAEGGSRSDTPASCPADGAQQEGCRAGSNAAPGGRSAGPAACPLRPAATQSPADSDQPARPVNGDQSAATESESAIAEAESAAAESAAAESVSAESASSGSCGVESAAADSVAAESAAAGPPAVESVAAGSGGAESAGSESAAAESAAAELVTAESGSAAAESDSATPESESAAVSSVSAGGDGAAEPAAGATAADSAAESNGGGPPAGPAGDGPPAPGTAAPNKQAAPEAAAAGSAAAPAGSGPAPVEGTSMVVKDPSLTPEEVNGYCQKRFQFKTIRLKKFTSWRDRRQYHRKKRAQRPQMSSKTKLLSFPVQPSRNSAAPPDARPREWVLNPGGKSYVCILHEYLQHVLREQPVYSYSELENAATPYGATVSVQGVRYGSGYGSSKKQAKSEAAKSTLQIFIPTLMDEIDGDKTVKGSTKPADMDLSFFDSIRLEDPRVADLCSKAAEPSPYTILLICLQRNFGLTSGQVTCKLHTNKHQHNEFEMTVGKHTARVPCKNKKDGKHLAAQSLLQQLHPHVTSWGSLLRMYGNHSSKSLKVKRQEEQQITLLQSKATVNSPNYAILEKLREEMGKLQEVRRQVKSMGILQLEEASAGPSESGVTLDVVDL